MDNISSRGTPRFRSGRRETTAGMWSGHMSRLLGMAALLAARAVAGAEIMAFVGDGQQRPIAEVVVVAVPQDFQPTLKPTTLIVDQVDKEFIPYVQPVMVGSSVSFPNNDDIRHHVYSFSQAKMFELPLYSGTPAHPVVFDAPGVVALGCNIHDWMLGFIYVVETPHFGKTDASGHIRLENLPAGAYSVRVWHPRMQESEDSTRRDVMVTDGEPQGLHWELALKPEPRLRRAPVVGRHSYR